MLLAVSLVPRVARCARPWAVLCNAFGVEELRSRACNPWAMLGRLWRSNSPATISRFVSGWVIIFLN